MSDDCCGSNEDDEDDEEVVYTVDAGAGWMAVSVDASTTEEAYEIWERTWDKMIDDIEDLSNEARLQAGIKQ